MVKSPIAFRHEGSTYSIRFTEYQGSRNDCRYCGERQSYGRSIRIIRIELNGAAISSEDPVYIQIHRKFLNGMLSALSVCESLECKGRLEDKREAFLAKNKKSIT